MGSGCSCVGDVAQREMDETELAEREEERRARIPPIRISVECDGLPAMLISVKSFEQVQASLVRELWLDDSEQTVKAAWLGHQKLDKSASWEDQAVGQDASVRASLCKAVLRGHTGAVRALAILPNGGIVTGSQDTTAIIWCADGEQVRVLRGHTSTVLSVVASMVPKGDIVTGS